jgi:hypothetical protein
MFNDEVSPLDQYVPAVIPGGFERSDRSLWFNRTHIGLQLFYRNPQGRFLRLELSDGPIGELMSMAEGAGRARLAIRGTEVELTTISSKPRKGKIGTALTIAAWQHKATFYRLQSDGLAAGDLETIISSLRP